jgi:TolA-binding protein
MKSQKQNCPDPLELSRIIEQGQAHPDYGHLLSCQSCRADAQLIQLAGGLPRYTPSAEKKNQVLSLLLSEASRLPLKPQRSWGAVRWALPIAAALMLMAGLWYQSQVPHLANKPTPLLVSWSSPDQASVLASSQEQHETLSLKSGTLAITANSPQKQLRVETKDVVVETTFAVFSIAAYEGRALWVEVSQGQVQLSFSSPEPKLLLQSGQRWDTPTATAQLPQKTAPKNPAKKPELVKATPELLVQPSEQIMADPAEEAYQAGVAALKKKDFTQAIALFSQAASTTKEPSLAEDASFWNTVALLQAGQTGAAQKSLQAFIARFPGSSRVGESRVALGWILVEQGSLEEAEALFTAALQGGVASVKASAQKGLDAINAKRQPAP